jgi:hypothetical protein
MYSMVACRRAYSVAVSPKHQAMSASIAPYLACTADRQMSVSDAQSSIMAAFGRRILDTAHPRVDEFGKNLALAIVAMHAGCFTEEFSRTTDSIVCANYSYYECNWPGRLLWSSQIHFLLGAHWFRLTPHLGTTSPLFNAELYKLQDLRPRYPTIDILSRSLGRKNRPGLVRISGSKEEMRSQERMKEMLCFHALVHGALAFIRQSEESLRYEIGLGMLVDAGYTPDGISKHLVAYLEEAVTETTCPSDALDVLLENILATIEATVLETPSASSVTLAGHLARLQDLFM